MGKTHDGEDTEFFSAMPHYVYTGLQHYWAVYIVVDRSKVFSSGSQSVSLHKQPQYHLRTC